MAVALFWVAKLLTVGMGEVASDWTVHRVGPFPAVAAGGLLFAATLVWQLAQDHYRPFVYWACVAMVSVFGTMAADVLHVGFHVPYLVSTAAWAVVLAAVFVVWARVEGTLSIHSITTLRREAFYFAAVTATFALGTAAGDMTARTLGLGYFASSLLFGLAILVPAIGWRLGGWSTVGCFWAAYVLTRPLGASMADAVGMPRRLGGLGLGTGPVALVLFAAIVVVVAVLAVTKVDVEDPALALDPVA